jgi:hypothetical protein
VLQRWGNRAFPPVPPLDRRARWALAGIVAVAAVLRLAWVTQVANPTELRDPVFYMVLGEHTANGHGWTYPTRDLSGYEPTAYYPPGYPMMLAALFWVVGLWPGDVSYFGTAVAANVVLSVVLVGLIFLLGRRLAGVRVGLVAAAATAVWPNLVFHSGVVLTETLFLVLFVLLFLVALATPAVARAPGRARLATVGVLLGLVGLVRPVSLVVAPLLLLLWWSGGVARAVRRTALVAGATVLVILPWAVFSSVRMESPVLLSLNFGDNLCIGYREGATGGFSLASECFDGYERYDRPEYETRRQSDNIERALTYIRENPIDAFSPVPDRARFTLQHDYDGLQAAGDYGTQPVFGEATVDRVADLADWYYWALSALAIAGVVIVVRRGEWADRRWQVFVLAAPVGLLSPLLTFGDPRFKMGIYPAVALCAAVAVVTLARRGPAFEGREDASDDDDGDASPARAEREPAPEPATTA